MEKNKWLDNFADLAGWVINAPTEEIESVFILFCSAKDPTLNLTCLISVHYTKNTRRLVLADDVNIGVSLVKEWDCDRYMVIDWPKSDI